MMFRTLFFRLIVLITFVAFAACRSQRLDDEPKSYLMESQTAAVVRVPQILQQATLDKYKAALPTIAFAKIQGILDDPDTLWYDHVSMPAVYQDTVSDTRGCRLNSSGASLIDSIPGGRKIFSPDGKTFNFPFGHTAGTDKSTNKQIVNFMSLPVVNGKRLPISYYIKSRQTGGLPVIQWRWTYPKGTVFGEFIYIKDQSGQLYPSELRTRERFLTGWATNIYRPYTTAVSLAKAIKKERPNWAENQKLQTLIEHLEDRHTMTAKSLRSTAFPGVFEQEGAIDEIPDFGDEALIKSLLTKKTFVSSYGAVWKASGDLQTFAASTKSQFSIVPNNYEAGVIEVRDQSCQRCHSETQRSIEDFASAAVLYGDIWGSDQIFSFHIFDSSPCHMSQNENRRLRSEFDSSGLVQKFDASVHPPEYYKELP